MFRFEHPEFLWSLALLPLMLLLRYVHHARRRSAEAQWGLLPPEALAFRRGQRLMQAGLVCALGVLLPVALANPQWGFKTSQVDVRSADVYLILDISNSMLARDVAPSRMERARQIAGRIAESLRTERLGLILFAGQAYIQSPLTTDWQAIRLFLQAADPSQAGTQGTQIGEAIRKILAADKDAQQAGGALILITDGEDHDDDAPDAMRDAAEVGWVPIVIGVGTEAGSTIPVMTPAGPDVKRDEAGNPIHTALNPSLLANLAQAGGGTYFNLAAEASLVEEIRSQVDALGQRKSETRVFTGHRSLYGWLLLPGLLILLLVAGARHETEII